jgi:ribosomal protein L15
MMSIQIPAITEEALTQLQREVQAEDAVTKSDWQAQSLINRIRQLEGVVQLMLNDVVPHVRDTGHNAADRAACEAINAARGAVPN